jgi:hypothetical protein
MKSTIGIWDVFRLVAMPSVWVLLVVLGMPVIGVATTLSELAEATQPGEWRTLSTHNDGSGFSGDLLAVEPPANILQYADKGMWNPNTRQVLFMGEGHNASAKFISYTETTHRWQEEPKPPWDCTPGCWSGIGHAYHHVTINPANGDIYARSYNSSTVHKYTKANDSWSQLPKIPESMPCCAALEYFPEMRGLIVVGAGTVVLFENSSNRWTTLSTGLAMGPYHNVAYYNTVNHVVYFGGGNGSSDLYKLDSSGKVTALRKAPTRFGINVTINAIDPVTGRLIVFRNSNSAYEYDQFSNTWNEFDPGSAPFSGSNPVANMMATSITTHGVIMLVRYSDNNSQAYLYRHAPRGMSSPNDDASASPQNLEAQ